MAQHALAAGVDPVDAAAGDEQAACARRVRCGLQHRVHESRYVREVEPPVEADRDHTALACRVGGDAAPVVVHGHPVDTDVRGSAKSRRVLLVQPMPEPIEFFFDFISPYGYLGATRIDALAHRHGRAVEWKPFLLGVTVMKVMGLKPLMDTPLKSDYLRHDKPRLAKLLGVPLAAPDMNGVNSLRASRAFLALRERDPALAKRFAQRVFQRLWVEGRDITPIQAVLEEAGALGADTAWLRDEVESPAGKARLETSVNEAIGKGVFGAPFFIADGEPFWGVDRLWMLDHWLTHRNWEPRPLHW